MENEHIILEGLEKEAQDYLTGKKFYGSIGMDNLWEPLSDAPRRDKPIEACHVLLTDPHRILRPGIPFSLSRHEQWTARLSALAWRRYNGPIRLITDREGAKYIRGIGLDEIYDAVEDHLWDPYGLKMKKFWASGKLLALKGLTLPAMIVDMDLVVWRPLPDIDDKPVAAAHIEHLNERFYPDPDTGYFLMSRHYQFPEDWDYKVEPLNTSLFYMNDEELRKDYLKEAIRFMQYERDTPDNGSNCMIFAEQRILAMCAARLGKQSATFMDYDRLGEAGLPVTHTWSGKAVLNQHAEAEEAFIEICREKCSQLELALSSAY